MERLEWTRGSVRDGRGRGVEAGWGQGRGFHGSGLLSGEEEKYSRNGGYRILFSGEVVGILVLAGWYLERWV